jgi:hypothetical protein
MAVANVTTTSIYTVGTQVNKSPWAATVSEVLFVSQRSKLAADLGGHSRTHHATG